ncbi:hypothetical protein ACI65C_012460 [Semiaphis heraclei]
MKISNNASDNLLNNLTNDLFLNTSNCSNNFEDLKNVTKVENFQTVISSSLLQCNTESMSVNNYDVANSSKSSLPSNKDHSLFSCQMDIHSDCVSLQDIPDFKANNHNERITTDNLCSYTTLHNLMHPILLRLTAIEKVQQKMANNLEIIGNHLVTISGEWSRRKLLAQSWRYNRYQVKFATNTCGMSSNLQIAINAYESTNKETELRVILNRSKMKVTDSHRPYTTE